MRLSINFNFSGLMAYYIEDNSRDALQASSTRKAFPCDECDKQYMSLEHLARHKRNTHGPDARPFKCEYCNKILKNKNTLQTHVYRKHSNMYKKRS